MPDAAGMLRRLVPQPLRADLDVVLLALPPAEQAPLVGTRLIVAGDEVDVPYRIYNPPLIASLALTPTQKRIADCLYTRHHDGGVRELSVLPLLQAPEPWTAPFIMLLLGEYVVEIAVTISAGLEGVATEVQREAFAPLLQDNPDFVRLIEQRAISYWNCYYRSAHPDRLTFPPLTVLQALRAL